VTFDNVAIDDGCVAGLQMFGDLVCGADLFDLAPVAFDYDESIIPQIGNPATTAASGGRAVDGDFRR